MVKMGRSVTTRSEPRFGTIFVSHDDDHIKEIKHDGAVSSWGKYNDPDTTVGGTALSWEEINRNLGKQIMETWG